MKKFILICVAALAVAGCSEYGALLKSTDHTVQYAAAKKYLAEGKWDKARVLLEKVIVPYTAQPQADSIMFYQGVAFYEQGQYDLSGELFDLFRTTYPRSVLLEQAEYMYALGHYKNSPEAVRDQTPTVMAIDAINTYISRYPGTPNRTDLETKRAEMIAKLHDKEFQNARTYYKIGQYKSAITALRNALKEYPETRHREEILYLTALSAYEYAENSVPAQRRARYLDMMERHLDYISEFPEGSHAEELTQLYEKARKYVNDGE